VNDSNGSRIQEPVGLADDELVPLSRLSVSALDSGFIHGIAVSEQVRTFRGRPFLLERHFQRWVLGLETLGVEIPCDFPSLSLRVEKVLQINSDLLPPSAEQGICFLATPGLQGAFAWPTDTAEEAQCGLGAREREMQLQLTAPRMLVHTYPLAIERWRQSYQRGIDLTTTPIRDVPAECWPRAVKIRSRLHYYLAQRAAEKLRPGSHPILLDSFGKVSDSAIGSIIGFRHDEGLIMRPAQDRYGSISAEFVTELAGDLGLPINYRGFTTGELQTFDEAFLVSTPWCIFPVATIDGIALSSVGTFPTFRRLVDQWSERVGAAILP
jgi:branched-chain amino acid aminotransferase